MDQEDSSEGVRDEFPLIPGSESGFSGVEDKESFDHESSTYSSELKKQAELAGPLIMAGFLQYSVQMISVMFIGHLGELSLSSATMANSFAGVTGYYFLLGMASALDTFFGQAHGAEQYHMLGIHMQRAMLVLLLACVPIAFTWNFTAYLFTLCGQDPEISTQSGIYARWLIPSIFPYGILQCQLRFLQAQSNTKPLILSTVVTTIFHVLTAWTLVFRVGLGNRGAALSIAVSYWINVLILAIYIQSSAACKKTWRGFSKEAVQDLVGFLSLAIPSACMICLEYWAYEFLVLMSGLLPNPKLETSMMAISFDTCSLVFRMPYGLGSAVSTRVSNELGAGRPRTARLAVEIALFLAAAQSLLLSLILIAVRNVWGNLYTNEEEVVKYVASVMPVLVISNSMDAIQAILSGTARGCGWQKIGAYVNLAAYYMIGLPSAIILTFFLRFRGKGLWMGIISGSGSQVLLLLLLTLRTDWEQSSKKARDRVYATGIPTAMGLQSSGSASGDFSYGKPYEEA